MSDTKGHMMGLRCHCQDPRCIEEREWAAAEIERLQAHCEMLSNTLCGEPSETQRKILMEHQKRLEKSIADRATLELKKENRALRERLAKAMSGYSECLEFAASGWAYADDYFKHKWCFEEEFADHKATLRALDADDAGGEEK